MGLEGDFCARNHQAEQRPLTRLVDLLSDVTAVIESDMAENHSFGTSELGHEGSCDIAQGLRDLRFFFLVLYGYLCCLSVGVDKERL